MIVNEILIRQSNPYDAILARLCEMVLDGREAMGRESGLVGAAVLDTAGNCVYATSSPEGDYWRHAERNALDAYEQKYGKLDPNSTIITTLSPCCSAMEDRYGSSCEDIINTAGIRNVYAGYDDYTQQEREPDFQLTFTKNKKLQQLCGKISNTFLKNDTPDTIAESRLVEGLEIHISRQRPPNSAQSPVGLYFKGFPCTKDCGGHMAGYGWAQKKNFPNASYVKPNEFHSNSFYEGALSCAMGR